MQPATEATVAGDFDGARFTDAKVTSTFFRRDGKFIVRTDGPDGTLGEYDVKYDWLFDHVVLLVPAQKAATFNLDEVMAKMQEGGGQR
jgi:hypothetical protein